MLMKAGLALSRLGVAKCLERSAQWDGVALKVASPGGFGVDTILDAVGAGADALAVYEALKNSKTIFSSNHTPQYKLLAGVQATSKSS
ncbi:hypothetical protein GGR55DRAFT_635804 [Xylaria sp. FL0064]|nr:hypothetical protein GGR55DRAFT_635804 [Xylaria sp. FL0064]